MCAGNMVTLKEAVIILAIATSLSSKPMDRPHQPTPPKTYLSYQFYEFPEIDAPAPVCTTIDSGITLKNGLIKDALHNLKQVLPCITFGIWPPKSRPSGDYVYINKGTKNGCDSKIGRIGGRQIMNLQSPGCMSVGTIMHEMIHALGFYHEQSRPDRDNFITILWKNIIPGFERNFFKIPNNVVTTFDVPYNYESIMHYDGFSLSKNNKPTIVAKNGAKVGSVGKLQDTDILKLKRIHVLDSSNMVALKEAVIILAIATTFSLSAKAIPIDGPHQPTPPKADLSYQFHEFANVEAPTCTTIDSAMILRNGKIDKRFRWKHFNVQPDRAYNQREYQLINDALYNLMQVLPCITFGIWPPNSKPTGDYVYIIKGTNNGCNSYVGRTGGKQPMNLQSPGCMNVGTIMHEMIHALGFYHEQSRPDRDNFINILWQNIRPGFEGNFNKYTDNMNGAKVGSVGKLQDTDILKLKRMLFNKLKRNPSIEAVIILAIATTLSLSAKAIPIDGPHQPTPPKADLSYQFHEFANVEAPTCTTIDSAMILRNGKIDKRFRWKHFNVQPDPAYNKREYQVINDALYNLMQVLPCITFGIWPPNSKPTGDYVYIIKGTNNGCNSHVGRIGGKQPMNLQSPGCMNVGTIMHEMIHALGFYHEQSRPDRDNYVTILWQNIQPGFAFAFDKYPSNVVTTFDVPYNYKSIMHYGGYDFSKNKKPTIVAKNGAKVGSDGKLQDTDILKLKRMYNCP
ncbi:Zinc metalloproteinase nas-4 [Pseudolycoriella hygida]|uniref:Metalloendopeptidase n=1 Tax=Pseudolycoriella hygida TaxID=35572 RepID=A0A9Q0MSH3_9DIPT|nr:Zinc metalloproteinase nas-4 [Pseudolycoriella hygida]